MLFWFSIKCPNKNKILFCDKVEREEISLFFPFFGLSSFVSLGEINKSFTVLFSCNAQNYVWCFFFCFFFIDTFYSVKCFQLT